MTDTRRRWSKGRVLIWAAPLVLVSALARGTENPPPVMELAQAPLSSSPSPQLSPIATRGVNPFDPIALNNKAVEYMERDDYEGALALLDRARRLAPDNVEIRRNYLRLKAWLERYGVPRAPARKREQESGTEQGRLPPEPPPPWQ